MPPFSFQLQAAYHVKESSGKKERRRACGGEIKASECDIKKFERATLGSGLSYSPGNCRMGWNYDVACVERSVRDRVLNSSSSSQVWHRDDNLFPRCEKSVREMNQRSSTEKSVLGVQNQLTEVKVDHHNLQVSDYRYIEKVFTNVRQKLNCLEGEQMLDQRDNVLTW